MSTTLCPSCGIAKPLDAFYRDASKAIGRRFVCKACDSERYKAYYRSHRAEKLAKVKSYQARVRDKRTPIPKSRCAGAVREPTQATSRAVRLSSRHSNVRGTSRRV
jgi:hypothetical protein